MSGCSPGSENAANVIRLAVSLAVKEASGCTRASAAFTYCSVWNISTFQLKNRLISAEPRLVIERTVFEARHAVHRFFDGPCDRHLHLIDGRDAVIDADHDRGKFVDGKTATGIVEAR